MNAWRRLNAPDGRNFFAPGSGAIAFFLYSACGMKIKTKAYMKCLYVAFIALFL